MACRKRDEAPNRSAACGAHAANARDWYQAEAELGEDFIAELRDTVARLRSLSERFPDVRPGVRRSLMNRFPYAIYFSVRADDVVIIAVLHHRRAPSALDDRLADEGGAV